MILHRRNMAMFLLTTAGIESNLVVGVVVCQVAFIYLFNNNSNINHDKNNTNTNWCCLVIDNFENGYCIHMCRIVTALSETYLLFP